MRGLTALVTDLQQTHARSLAVHGRVQQTSGFFVRPNCQCKPPPSCHATLSGANRLRGDRHLLAPVQESERKVIGNFLSESSLRPWDCRAGIAGVVLASGSWTCTCSVVKRFLVVTCCEPHASSVILLMRRCCATSWQPRKPASTGFSSVCCGLDIDKL
jgi:hypothetical protein